MSTYKALRNTWQDPANPELTFRLGAHTPAPAFQTPGELVHWMIYNLMWIDGKLDHQIICVEGEGAFTPRKVISRAELFSRLSKAERKALRKALEKSLACPV